MARSDATADLVVGFDNIERLRSEPHLVLAVCFEIFEADTDVCFLPRRASGRACCWWTLRKTVSLPTPPPLHIIASYDECLLAQYTAR